MAQNDGPYSHCKTTALLTSAGSQRGASDVSGVCAHLNMQNDSITDIPLLESSQNMHDPLHVHQYTMLQDFVVSNTLQAHNPFSCVY